MEVYRRSSWLLLLFVQLQLVFIALQGVYGELDIQEGPSESECRPYIEKALKQLETGDTVSPQDDGDSKEDIPTVEITTDDSDQPIGYGENEDDNSKKESNESVEDARQDESEVESNEKDDSDTEDDTEKDTDDIDDNESGEQVTSDEIGERHELTVDQVLAKEHESEVVQELNTEPSILQESTTPETIVEDKADDVIENLVVVEEIIVQSTVADVQSTNIEDDTVASTITAEDADSKEDTIIIEEIEIVKATAEAMTADNSKEVEGIDDTNTKDIKDKLPESAEDNDNAFEANSKEVKEDITILKEKVDSQIQKEDKDKTDEDKDDDDQKESKQDNSSEENTTKDEQGTVDPVLKKDKDTRNEPGSKETEEILSVEDLIEESKEDLLELRSRDHISHLLKLDEDSNANTKVIERTSDIILRDLKKLYDTAIKPLETLYKYKDLSNRHYGDSEIFAKPLILFMGPWSGGKSSIINYLLGIEYSENALHTGAEPSPAYFNILMYGEEPEILDGTQLAADNTFSGLQKFGQGLEERLRGYKLPNKLLEKVNIVEIPGILEVRKQVSRVFPFNDACQWFIDRADIIFLVYDPSKLDVGPETEAILDQLKGREHQTRIVLNKADQVKPEELLRVQGALIWNISPLMSSAQPPIMYTTSLWSKPYESWAPVRLLQAQERAFLRDIRSAVDKRIDNKIASARRFAVRVRNHAKMVDCYLTTYYNHKSVFGNRKQISDEIINHPQDFHIYEGLSTLTNISRYDLPDPDVYRDFFRLNALYDFQQLSATCTYFRGCPINRLDIAIAYDLPELVGKHKKLIETAINDVNKPPTPKS